MWTLSSVTEPVFVAVIVNDAVPPVGIVCVFGLLTMSIAGLLTVTWALSLSVTSAPPPWGLPVTVATFVKLAVTFARVQVYVCDAPGASDASAAMSFFVL